MSLALVSNVEEQFAKKCADCNEKLPLNRIKSDATPTELELLVKYLKENNFV